MVSKCRLSNLLPEGKHVIKRQLYISLWEKQLLLFFGISLMANRVLFYLCFAHSYTEHRPPCLPAGSEATPLENHLAMIYLVLLFLHKWGKETHTHTPHSSTMCERLWPLCWFLHHSGSRDRGSGMSRCWPPTLHMRVIELPGGWWVWEGKSTDYNITGGRVIMNN